MAAANFAACLGAVLRWEGGWSDHPRDPGGATNMGITLATLRDWRHAPVTKADVKALTRDEAGKIYAARYWRPLAGDELPEGADLATFDYGVNSGIGRAAQDAQRVAGAEVDGKIGPKTLAAIRGMGPRAYVKALCARRMGFLRSLAIWSTFGKGWTNRVADIEARALAMCSTRAQLEDDAKAAGGKAAGQAGGAAGAGGGALALPDLPAWVWVLLVLVVVAPLVIRAVINLQRARALVAASRGELS